MAPLDPLARAGTIAILCLVGVVLLRGRPRSVVSWATCALIVVVAAHLIVSSPDYRRWPAVDALLRGAALAAPAVFWFFTRAFFGDDDRLNGWNAAALVTLVAVGFWRPAAVAETVYYAGSVALVVLALVQVMRGLRIDLVEPRRRMRAVFTVILGIEILTVLGVELWLGGAAGSRDVEVVKSVSALALTLAFGGWLLAPRTELLAAVPAPAPAVPGSSVEPVDADARLRERLLATMHGEQLYKQEGLTIGALAQKLDVPEYRVRRIVNQQLGHRNFNAFLNELRTAEACRILADPAHERLPIFNLALDLGYGSLGPFNRAFRAKTGQTPTEYRRAHRQPPARTSESPAES
jgi:AraC-like DNA-binding protein